MNLNISYNWLKKYVATKKSAQEFAKEISLCGPSVDHIKFVKPNFSKVVVGEILSLEKHPNADKLNFCKVNVGKETLDIVCGAPNIKAGQKVPVVLVGGKVGDMEVVQAKIRGLESFGMMCSQKELGIGDDHTGIYILPDYVEVGLPLEKIMPIEDEIFDLEVTSNRPDAMSIVGIAREAAAILEEKFLYEESKPNLKIQGDKKKISVNVKENELCRRYQAVVLTNVKVAASPLWMQQRLLSAGLRPINNLVDITNYILLEFGQPMHVFDYDKVADAEINVRLAKKGETIQALDGKNYELTTDTLVIADSGDPLAVAGIMGGEPSAATENTATIIFEAASFDPVSVRKTARTLNLYSDSSSLFEKNLHPARTNPALMRAIELAIEIAEAKVASEIIDEGGYKERKEKINLDIHRISDLLGTEIKKDQVKKILTGLGFTIETGKDNDTISVTIPWWRQNDIEGDHDLIEEVARIYGYHNLPAKLPTGEIPIGEQSDKKQFSAEDNIKNILGGSGLTEIYSYSFISEKDIRNCLLKKEDHIQISNPLSADFEYMRTTLIAGLLQSISENESNFPVIKIFELSRIYKKMEGDLPQEKVKLGIAVATDQADEAFYLLKGIIEKLARELYINNLNFDVADGHFWQPNQCLKIIVSGDSLGFGGSINQEIVHLFGIKKNVAAAEIDFEAILEKISAAPTYQPLPRFPGIDLDLSMEIDRGVRYQKILEAISDINPLIKKVTFLSEYHGDKVESGKKAVAIRLEYRDNDKTLKLEEAQATHQQVIKKLEKEYNIKVR